MPPRLPGSMSTTAKLRSLIRRSPGITEAELVRYTQGNKWHIEKLLAQLAQENVIGRKRVEDPYHPNVGKMGYYPHLPLL
jgi:seryl-tRNA(Sec) selenium transferase